MFSQNQSHLNSAFFLKNGEPFNHVEFNKLVNQVRFDSHVPLPVRLNALSTWVASAYSYLNYINCLTILDVLDFSQNTDPYFYDQYHELRFEILIKVYTLFTQEQAGLEPRGVSILLESVSNLPKHVQENVSVVAMLNTFFVYFLELNALEKHMQDTRNFKIITSYKILNALSNLSVNQYLPYPAYIGLLQTLLGNLCSQIYRQAHRFDDTYFTKELISKIERQLSFFVTHHVQLNQVVNKVTQVIMQYRVAYNAKFQRPLQKVTNNQVQNSLSFEKQSVQILSNDVVNPRQENENSQDIQNTLVCEVSQDFEINDGQEAIFEPISSTQALTAGVSTSNIGEQGNLTPKDEKSLVGEINNSINSINSVNSVNKNNEIKERSEVVLEAKPLPSPILKGKKKEVLLDAYIRGGAHKKSKGKGKKTDSGKKTTDKATNISDSNKEDRNYAEKTKIDVKVATSVQVIQTSCSTAVILENKKTDVLTPIVSSKVPLKEKLPKSSKQNKQLNHLRKNKSNHSTNQDFLESPPIEIKPIEKSMLSVVADSAIKGVAMSLWGVGFGIIKACVLTNQYLISPSLSVTKKAIKATPIAVGKVVQMTKDANQKIQQLSIVKYFKASETTDTNNADEQIDESLSSSEQLALVLRPRKNKIPFSKIGGTLISSLLELIYETQYQTHRTPDIERVRRRTIISALTILLVSYADMYKFNFLEWVSYTKAEKLKSDSDMKNPIPVFKSILYSSVETFRKLYNITQPFAMLFISIQINLLVHRFISSSSDDRVPILDAIVFDEKIYNLTLMGLCINTLLKSTEISHSDIDRFNMKMKRISLILSKSKNQGPDTKNAITNDEFEHIAGTSGNVSTQPLIISDVSLSKQKQEKKEEKKEEEKTLLSAKKGKRYKF